MKRRLDRVRRALSALLHPGERARGDVDEELHAHIEARVDYLMERGMTPEAARAEAIRRFGDLEGARTALHAHALGNRRRVHLADRLQQFAQDARYVARGLTHSPSFSAGVVATLALGLGINAAVFEVADHVLLRPPPGVADVWSIRRVETTVGFGSGPALRSSLFSHPDARLIAESGAFAVTSTYSPPRLTPAGDGREAAVSVVDDRFFRLLGADPPVGRAFDAREAEAGARPAVAVVSFDYWQRELAAALLTDRSTIRLGERTFRIIGVAPKGFIGIDLDPADVWLPVGDGDFGGGMVNGVVIPWYRSEMLRALRVIGRPPAHNSDEVVVQQLTAVFGSADADAGRPPREAVLHRIVPAGDPSRTEAANRLLARLSGVAAIVLLIACANAMNLLLARAMRRHHEIAIRMAIGASRARVSRLLVIESMTLALCGGAAALLCGTWAASGLQRLLFPDARWTASAWDERTLLFTGLITIAAGVLAGLAPVLQWTTPDLVSGLTATRAVGSLRSRTTRASLVVVQIALSLALLVGSGLLVMSLIRLDAVNLGFDPDGLVTVSISPVSLNSIRNRQSSPAPEVAARAAASEGVEAVALASVAPFGATRMIDISVPGSPFVPESVRDQPLVNFVSANYFSVMATRVLRGRGFDDRDASGSEPVAVVSDSMARRYWGGTIPEGGCILRYGGPCARVVGTIEDVRDAPGGEAPRMRFYLPLTQVSDLPDAVIVRTDAERASMVAGILRSTAPAGYRDTVEVISDRVGRALRPWRTAALLFIAFGVVALALACIGVYSVMSYIAAERVHELGVRIVLGATARDVLRLVLIDKLRLSVLGGVVGVCGAAVAARYLGSLLFEVSPFEPAIYALGLLCLTGAGLCAMLPAALRASRVDPVVALRRE